MYPASRVIGHCPTLKGPATVKQDGTVSVFILPPTPTALKGISPKFEGREFRGEKKKGAA